LAKPVTILDRIIADKRIEVESAKKQIDIDEMQRRCVAARETRGFAKGISKDGLSVIAEIKRASPSAGLFAPDLDAVDTACAYEIAGASALSVLTDRKYFHGCKEDLTLARDAVGLPVLRKDFIVDVYQIYESRAIGADAVLIIISAVTNERDLIEVAKSAGLDCLVEVHDEYDLDRALQAGASIVGINNRDLRTFHTDLAVTEQLLPLVPEGVVTISESGIKSVDDIARVHDCGVDAILVGESLARNAADPTVLKSLIGADYG
tara:strand:+ start:1974 stop:2765 length:792 start_codon:yes stop_codon:yes gene_type:complete